MFTIEIVDWDGKTVLTWPNLTQIDLMNKLPEILPLVRHTDLLAIEREDQ